METRKSKSGTKGVSPEGTELGSETKQLAGEGTRKCARARAVRRGDSPVIQREAARPSEESVVLVVGLNEPGQCGADRAKWVSRDSSLRPE